MKKLLFFILAVFTFFFIACGSDSNNNNNNNNNNSKCNPACNSWQTCNETSKQCELNSNACETNSDCKDSTKPKCNLMIHTCSAEAAPECSVDSDCKDSTKPKCSNGICIANNSNSVIKIKDIEKFVNLGNACGLGEAADISEDIYMMIDILNIDDDSPLGKGIGFFAMNELKEKYNNALVCFNAKANMTCDELAACLGIEITDTTCDTSDFTESCDGNKTVKCNWKGKVIKTTCDNTCETDDDNKATCVEADTRNCDSSNDKPTCNADGTITYCGISNHWVTTFCGEGRTCDETVKGGCKVDASLPDCDDTYKDTCDGKYQTTCYNGKVVRNNCEDIAGTGFVCKENPTMFDSWFFLGCVYNEVKTTCKEETTCNGNILSYCVDGQSKTYDCVANGYDECKTLTIDSDRGQKDSATCNYK